MTYADPPRGAACPGCLVAGETVAKATVQAQAGDQTVQISLPSIHCAGCISTVERGLTALADVRDVRVNLTRKRATVTCAPGMDPAVLIAELAQLGYDGQVLDGQSLNAGTSDRAARELAMRLGIAGFAMMNVMLLSVAVWSGASDATRDLFHWISAAITLPTIAFAAQPFFGNAWRALRVGRLNMDVPISLAILLAATLSLFETIQGGDEAYFDAALSLTFFLLAGRYMDQRMRSTARSAAAELAALEVPTALRVTDGTPATVRLEDLIVGDVLLVQPGARVPVDGIVTTGNSELDRAFLTGESDPVAIAPGGAVRAGEVNLTGLLYIEATAVGADTLLHGLADLVAVAEAAKSKYNALADRAARIYAPLVHVLAFAAFGFWLWWAGDFRVAINIAVAVLIITCPCALGLAVPAVSTVASGRLFKRGLLVKHATALERLAEVDAVVFDKTGTLTMGTPEMAGTLAPQDMALAAALAAASGHPRSKAIVQAASALALPAVTVTDITEEPGMGVQGVWQGHMVRLGRGAWVGATDGATYLAVGDNAPVTLQFEDKLRPGAAALVAQLQAAGKPVTLLSGDATDHVKTLANAVGIAEWQAEVLPQDKAAHLAQMRDAGQRVLMVGDGLNDVAALAAAHVSIAPGTALEAARMAADVVLVSPDLSRIADALAIGSSARRRILENFALAATYNMIAVPFAFAGFASPLAAAIAMSSSSILVSLNALRVR